MTIFGVEATRARPHDRLYETTRTSPKLPLYEHTSLSRLFNFRDTPPSFCHDNRTCILDIDTKLKFYTWITASISNAEYHWTGIQHPSTHPVACTPRDASSPVHNISSRDLSSQSHSDHIERNHKSFSILFSFALMFWIYCHDSSSWTAFLACHYSLYPQQAHVVLSMDELDSSRLRLSSFIRSKPIALIFCSFFRYNVTDVEWP
ncbi:hypothetical protein BDV96DRAFT_357185 [Lophiotrema nucula]|uniref:Uncharacterized protein n=1 Tax=Lophiotrema nucula TaxID=690887 RepID=A0A6A5YFM2_9PLEO|nr:hypothetical protein BDV96DRAFT_357185 [Lophiotrema nucula]